MQKMSSGNGFTDRIAIFAVSVVVVIIIVFLLIHQRAAIIGTKFTNQSSSSSEIVTQPPQIQSTFTAKSSLNETNPVSKELREGSLKELLSFKKDLTCTIVKEGMGSPGFGGAIYISHGMLRGDFYTGGGATPTTHTGLLLRNQSDQAPAYIWTGSEGHALSVAEAVSFKLPVSFNTQEYATLNLEEKISYRCLDWQADSSKFVVPQDVTLVNVGGQTQYTAHTDWGW